MKLLFICTHNRCRSILAEAITNHVSGGRITAVSAGSSPEGQVHPLSLKYLQERNINTVGLASQSWNDFQEFAPDAILTMCDKAAQETCPVWFNHAVQVDWSLEDPSTKSGGESEQRKSFNHAMNIIEQRIQALLENQPSELSGTRLKKTLSRLAAEIS